MLRLVGENDIADSSIGMNAMESSINTLAELIPLAEKKAEGISRWSVGQHIEHAMLATIKMSEALLASTAGEKTQKFSLLRWSLFTLGWLPRGKAKAPELVIPEERPSTERLEELVQAARVSYEKAQGADPQQWFGHFIFGVLNKKSTLRLIAVHNRHHLKIAREIVRST